MNRRELLKQIALLTGGVVVGGEVFLTGCSTGNKSKALFSDTHIALLDELGETIIPATDTPGAKAAKIGEFMQAIVTDCYTQEEQNTFVKGMENINVLCEKQLGKNFMDCNAEERKGFVISLEKEAKAYNESVTQKNEADKAAAEAKGASFVPAPLHYYSMMKQLTLWGFFTSKTGMTETLRHVAVPGRYDGSAPYAAGEKAWAGD